MNRSLFWGSYAIGFLSIRSVAKMNVLSKAFVRVIIDSLVLHTRSFCPLRVNVGKIPSLSIIPIWVHFLHSRFISMEQSVRCILLPPPLVASIALSHPLMPARHSRCKDRHTPCVACWGTCHRGLGTRHRQQCKGFWIFTTLYFVLLIVYFNASVIKWSVSNFRRIV